jgi:hypothetical protein
MPYCGLGLILGKRGRFGLLRDATQTSMPWRLSSDSDPLDRTILPRKPTTEAVSSIVESKST